MKGTTERRIKSFRIVAEPPTPTIVSASWRTETDKGNSFETEKEKNENKRKQKRTKTESYYSLVGPRIDQNQSEDPHRCGSIKKGEIILEK